MQLPPPTAMSADPLLAVAILGCAGTAAWLLRHGDSVGRARWMSLAAGTALLAIIWLTPLATVAQHYLLSAHLLQVTVLMGAVPPLLLLSLPRRPRVHVAAPVLRVLRLFTHPLFAIIAVNAAFFGWHTTVLYTAAMRSEWLAALEQISLLVASIAFWWPIITPFAPPARSMTPLMKMGYILLATIPQTFGGLVVALAHHTLYPLYAQAPRLLGLDVMTDQQIAGASIALVSKVALFSAFIVIFMRALDSGGEPDDGGGDGGIRPVIEPRPLPSGTPAWLFDVARGRTVSEPRPRRRVRVPAGSGPGRG